MWIAIGIVVTLVVIVVALKVFSGGGGGVPFPPGTKAFESYLTLRVLMATIESRKVARDAEANPDKRARLDREIAFLIPQVDEHQAIVDAKDVSPGAGYVGFRAYNE